MDSRLIFSILVGLLGVFLFSGLFSLFVFLAKMPLRRAASTVGLSYLICTTWGIAAGGIEHFPPSMVPFIFLPGALAAFLFFWMSFCRSWVDDSHAAETGIALVDSEAGKRRAMAIVGLVILILAALLAQGAANELFG